MMSSAVLARHRNAFFGPYGGCRTRPRFFEIKPALRFSAFFGAGGARPRAGWATLLRPWPPPIQAQPPQPTVRGRIGMPCRLLNVPRPHLSFLEERPSISPPGARRLNGGER